MKHLAAWARALLYVAIGLVALIPVSLIFFFATLPFEPTFPWLVVMWVLYLSIWLLLTKLLINIAEALIRATKRSGSN